MPILRKYQKKGVITGSGVAAVADPVVQQKREEKREEADKQQARKQLFRAWQGF